MANMKVRPVTTRAIRSRSERVASDIVVSPFQRSGMCRHRVNDGDDLIDFSYRKAREPGVLAKELVAFGKVDAERVVGSDVRLHPLHLPGKLGNRSIRGRGKILELGAIQAADHRD